jgi:hypothetical protein
MSTQEENAAKVRWVSNGMMNGDNAGIEQALLQFLPPSTKVDSDGQRQLELARNYMAELWLRGITKNRFLEDTGLTGAHVDLVQPGMVRQTLMGEANPTYFRLWLADPAVAAESFKNILRDRLNSMNPEYAGWFRLLFYIDIDTENKEFSLPYEAGLTPKAICFDTNLANVEGCFAAIDAACASLGKLAQQKLRIGLGSFAQQEYDGVGKHSVYTKRMFFNMGTEWILFKNIYRRAGKFGSFWRLVAKLRDRHDNG